MQLIDKEALIAEIKNAEKCYRESKCLGSEPFPYKLAFADGAGAVADLIVRQAPTIEERKHGHWEDDPCICGCWVCSNCNKHIYNCYNMNDLSAYCPRCGAKMDEEVKND